MVTTNVTENENPTGNGSGNGSSQNKSKELADIVAKINTSVPSNTDESKRTIDRLVKKIVTMDVADDVRNNAVVQLPQRLQMRIAEERKKRAAGKSGRSGMVATGLAYTMQLETIRMNYEYEELRSYYMPATENMQYAELNQFRKYLDKFKSTYSKKENSSKNSKKKNKKKSKKSEEKFKNKTYKSIKDVLKDGRGLLNETKTETNKETDKMRKNLDELNRLKAKQGKGPLSKEEQERLADLQQTVNTGRNDAHIDMLDSAKIINDIKNGSKDGKSDIDLAKDDVILHNNRLGLTGGIAIGNMGVDENLSQLGQSLNNNQQDQINRDEKTAQDNANNELIDGAATYLCEGRTTQNALATSAALMSDENWEKLSKEDQARLLECLQKENAKEYGNASYLPSAALSIGGMDVVKEMEALLQQSSVELSSSDNGLTSSADVNRTLVSNGELPELTTLAMSSPPPAVALTDPQNLSAVNNSVAGTTIGESLTLNPSSPKLPNGTNNNPSASVVANNEHHLNSVIGANAQKVATEEETSLTMMNDGNQK